MIPILPIRFTSRKTWPKRDSIHQSHEYGELYYSYNGVMELMINDKHYIAPKHYCIWLPPNTIHRCISQKEILFFTLHIDPIWASNLSAQVCVLSVSTLMQQILEYLHHQPTDMLDIPSNQHLLQVAYDQLLQAPCSDNYLPHSSDPIIAPILHLLANNPADDRSIKELAKMVNTTERTLMRRAIQELGMSLIEWKLRLRVVRAITMLNQGLSVERTALDLGYSSSSAFISMFRKLMGITPGEFRHQ